MNWKHALLIAVAIVVVTGVICVGAVCVAWMSDGTASDRQREHHTDTEDADKLSDTSETGTWDTLRDSVKNENAQKESAQKENFQKENDQKESAQSEKTEGKDTENAKEKETYGQIEESQLKILLDPMIYSYEDMQQDLEKIPYIYDAAVRIDSLGRTADGRDIYHITVGEPDGAYKIFINGSIHGREYMTSQLVMKQLVTFLSHVSSDDDYQGQSYKSLMEDTVIHVVPMINPDGVSISQFGLDAVRNETVKNKIREIAAMDGSAAEGYYLTRWKANANGVDLNRNFNALWDSYEGSGHPSSDHYKGIAVGCETESAALITLTKQQMFDRTISYHTQGSVIYWYFGQDGDLYDESWDFANCISAATGYPTDANYEYLDPAGYKDWGIRELGIPGLTVEIGYDTSPVPAAQFAGIWQKNQFVWEETILHAKSYER